MHISASELIETLIYPRMVFFLKKRVWKNRQTTKIASAVAGNGEAARTDGNISIPAIAILTTLHFVIGERLKGENRSTKTAAP
jgi:hypothetical protein